MLQQAVCDESRIGAAKRLHSSDWSTPSVRRRPRKNRLFGDRAAVVERWRAHLPAASTYSSRVPRSAISTRRRTNARRRRSRDTARDASISGCAAIRTRPREIRNFVAMEYPGGQTLYRDLVKIRDIVLGRAPRPRRSASRPTAARAQAAVVIDLEHVHRNMRRLQPLDPIQRSFQLAAV